MKRLKSVTASLLLLFLVVACTGKDPQQRVTAAKDHIQRGDRQAATIELKQALQDSPHIGEARYLLGSMYLKDGNPVAAEVELRKAFELGYPEEIVVPDLARAMVQLGQGKKIVDEFGSSKLGNASADASLQTTLVAAYASLGKSDQAKAALEAALQADPNYAPAQLISARQKALTGDADGAHAAIDAVLARNPSDTDALKFKGDLLLSAGKSDEALAVYRKALQADPKNLHAHVGAMSILMQQGNPDEVAKQLEQLKLAAPKDPQTRFYEARLAYLKKDYKRARDIARELVQVMPNNALMLQFAGAAELQAGTPAQAEIYLSTALRIAPRLVLARRLLIESYLRTGQANKALAELSATAGKGDALDPALFSLAGQAYLQSGDAKKAEEYFAKALKLDPGNASKRTQLALTHIAAGGQAAEALDELQDIATDDAGVTADLALINAHLLRREFDKALAAIDRLEKKQPDKPIAANLRGNVLYAKQDNAGARQSFERALTIDPNFFAAAASLAALDTIEKKPDEAKKRFEALLARNPKNTQALLALAGLAASSGATRDEVGALLSKAAQANPADPAPQLLLIDHYLRYGENKQALAAAQSAATAAPDDPQLLLALGRVQQVSGDVNQAIATYAKAVKLQPLSPVPLVRLAEAQVVSKDTKGAEQNLRKALQIKADHLDAQRGLVIIFLAEKAYAEALKVARSIQQQRPKEASGYVLEGEVAVAQQSWEAAAKAYRVALRYSTSPALATKLHSILTAAGKSGEADAFASAWRKEHPQDVAFVEYLAELAIARKDYATAERHYLSALKLRPDTPATLNNLAFVAGQLHKDGAIEMAEKANRLAPNEPTFMDTLAMLLAERKEFPRAVEIQRRALELQPDNASLRLNLAKIYVKAGDKSRARTELTALTKLGDQFPRQQEVAEILSTL